MILQTLFPIDISIKIKEWVDIINHLLKFQKRTSMTLEQQIRVHSKMSDLTFVVKEITHKKIKQFLKEE
jgi:hypothetical protein